MTDRQPDQTADSKNIRRFVSFVGICVLLLSQLLVFSEPLHDNVFIPPYTPLAMLGIAILIAGQWIPPTAFWQRLSGQFVFQDRVFWVTAAFLLSVVATIATGQFMTFRRLNYIPILMIWLLAAACYLYAYLAPRTAANWDSVSSWLRTHRSELLVMLSIGLFAVTIRFLDLGAIPRVLDGDEGRVGLTALSTATGDLANPFALWENFGGLYLQLIHVSMTLFGENPFGLRFTAAVGGVLAIPAVYLLSRLIAGPRIAVISAILIAISHSHLHFSRIVSVAYIQDSWLVPLELYLLLSGLERREAWRSALGGILLAVHYSVYLTSQIITVLIVLFMLIAFLAYRSWFRERLAQAWIFWGGFLIMIMPSALYSYRQPHQFLDRLGSDGTFHTNWLALSMQTTGQSAVEILLGRLLHAFLSLTYYPAFDFYGSLTPLMGVISGTLLFTGLGIILWRIRNPSYLLLNGYFWGTTVAVGVFAIPPSADSYRMLMTLPAAVIIASVGLDQLLGAIHLSWKETRTAYTFTVSTLLTGLLFFNLWTYYVEFAGQCLFPGDQQGRFASYLGSELRQLTDENPAYLLSDGIFVYGSHSSTQFLSGNRPAINFTDPIETLPVFSGQTVIATPSRVSELQEWARVHPGGELRYTYDCGNVILLSYRLP